MCWILYFESQNGNFAQEAAPTVMEVGANPLKLRFFTVLASVLKSTNLSATARRV